MKITNITIAVLLTGYIGAGAAAQATTVAPELHDKARKALQLQDYKGVVSIYGDSDEANLQGNGHYRMAIALERLDLPIRAFIHLNKALAADPTGKFASAPDKFEQLKTRILAACASQGAPSCNEVHAAAPVEQPAPEPEPAQAPTHQSAQVDAPATAPSPLVAPAAPLPAPVAEIPPAPAALPDPTPQIGDAGRTIITILSAVLGALLVALLYALVTLKKLKTQRKGPTHHIAVTANRTDEVSLIPKKTALEELLSSLEDQMSITPKDTILFEKMQALLPQAQTEYGRIQFAKTRNPESLTQPDREQLAAAIKFEKTPMTMANASPDEIVALFQSSSWLNKQ